MTKQQLHSRKAVVMAAAALHKAGAHVARLAAAAAAAAPANAAAAATVAEYAICHAVAADPEAVHVPSWI